MSATQHFRAPSPRPRRSAGACKIENLEQRRLLTVLLDPFTQPKFVNPVANPLDPSFIFTPESTGGSHYELGVRQTTQWLGLVDPVTGAPLQTTVWGYANVADPLQGTTYPGRTIVAQTDQPITVRWLNQLVDATGNPLSHLLPVDSTLHWADPLNAGHVGGPYTGPVPIVTHLHGGHTRSDSDGLPDAWYTPDGNDSDTAPDYVGRLYNEVLTYDNDQEAATIWYHDHALGITRLNVYAGMAGFYIVRDAWDTGLPDNPAGLPYGQYEIPLVIQDRMFTADGQLFYPSEGESSHGMLTGTPTEPEPTMEIPNPTVLPEFFGDHILVNGTAWPFASVEPRQYRLRLLNGSDSRFYNLRLNKGTSTHLAGPQIAQIGSDGGLLNQPVYLDQLTLAPGERADVIIDFSGFAGQNLTLRNNAKSPFPNGGTVNPQTTGQIMQFRVGTTVTTPDRPIPASLRPAPIQPLSTNLPARKLMLFEGMDHYGRLQPMLGTVNPGSTLDGTLLWDDPVTENPLLNSTEVWEIYNSTADAHPIHLHLVQFQVLGRQRFGATVIEKEMEMESTGGILTDIKLRGRQAPPELNERGWKDTVIMYPGQVTRIIARFDRTGEYVWHCHILSHEDHEMMRPFVVTTPPEQQTVASVTLDVAGGVFAALPISRLTEDLFFHTPGQPVTIV